MIIVYRKIPKISPGAFISFQRPFLRGLPLEGLYSEGNLCLKNDWTSLILGRKFTVFLWFTFEGNFQVHAPPPRGLYLEGRFNGGFFALGDWGLIFRGAYIWRALYMEGLFLEFYGNLQLGDVPGADLEKSLYAFGQLEKR